jgi:hypothetical protein
MVSSRTNSVNIINKSNQIIKIQINHFHQKLFLPTLFYSVLEANIGMGKIALFAISKILFEFCMLNLKILGFIFLSKIFHSRMRKIRFEGVFISTSDLALACF